MREIASEAVIAAVKKLCITAAYKLPEDVFNALQNAVAYEKSPQGKAALNQCIENATIAQLGNLPICQDTGIALFYVTIGEMIHVSGCSITEAINTGCREGYQTGYLRASIVDDPLFERKNTGDNTPAIIHYDIVPGDVLEITILPKGGGCENMSALAMLKPSDGVEGVIDFTVSVVKNAGGNPCPPVIVGIGIGGNADKASFLAKKALLRSIGSKHINTRYAALENDIFTKINKTGNGPQGLGGLITTLGVFIETAPCHIASLPVAVNLNCHAARHASVSL